MVDPTLIRTRAEWTQALQALFARAGLSYHSLAERCGISTSTLQKMVTGQSFPRPSTVRLFVLACGIDDSRLWLEARKRVVATDATLRRHRTPPSRQIRIGALPRAADCFQDRQVAARIGETAEAEGTVVLTQVLAGMGGVGKTQLAAAYARHAWHQGVGVLVWVNAATRDGVISAYADAALRLRLPLADPIDPERSAREFLTWAETTTDRWWLVVLDDVRSTGDMRGLWPPAAGSVVGGQVVITTRLRESALAGGDRRMAKVGTFTKDEARNYLKAKLGHRTADLSQADALAGDLGYLPLALAQAATYILNADIDCAAYRGLLAARLLPRALPDPEHLPDDHEQIVAATWELSIDQADRAEPIGLARPVLYLASVLDPAGIPQAVLASPQAREYLTGYLHPAAQETAPSVEMVDEALRVLHRHSLIDHDRAATLREVRIHQLVQRATRENLATQPDLGPDLFAALADTAADALLAAWHGEERNQLGQILRANTTALHQVTGTALCNLDTGAHEVLFRAAYSLGESGQVTAAITAHTDLHATCLHQLGPNHPDTLAVRGCLAQWQGEAGDAAGAAAVYQALLPDMVRVLGPDHPDTLAVRGCLARWRGETGDAAGAAAACLRLLPKIVQVLGLDDDLTLTIRSDLARWRGEAGDAAGAAAALQELLADRERVLGANHPHTLATRNNLASWRGMAGDAAGAVAALEKLLADYQRVLDNDHPELLTTRHELARWRGEAGDAAGAVAALQELVRDRERVLGANHPHTLATRNNLASWRGMAGDAAGAVAALEELLADCQRVLGNDHPHTLATRNASAYWRKRAAPG